MGKLWPSGQMLPTKHNVNKVNFVLFLEFFTFEKSQTNQEIKLNIFFITSPSTAVPDGGVGGNRLPSFQNLGKIIIFWALTKKYLGKTRIFWAAL